ncbi:MAG: helicase-related protein [Nitrospirota bacterium]
MSYEVAREIIRKRVESELIGPGSDLFLCSDAQYKDEVIEGKPLSRYFSGVLFPKMKQADATETGEEEYNDESTTEEDNWDNSANILTSKHDTETSGDSNHEKEDDIKEPAEDEEDTETKYVTNTFYPSNIGISFCLDKSCQRFNVVVSFGNYKKAKYSDIKLRYDGDDIRLIQENGLDFIIGYDEENKALYQKKELIRTEKGEKTNDYKSLQSGIQALKKDNYSHPLAGCIQKLFFKDKYKRYNNEIFFEVKLDELLRAKEQHKTYNLSDLPNTNFENWHKDMKGNIVLHAKLYTDDNPNKYYLKILLENTLILNKKFFSQTKEKTNQCCLFQTEIKVLSDKLLPFKEYGEKTDYLKGSEDEQLDFLFRDKRAYGIGHNTGCTWEKYAEDSVKPKWIKSTFIPEFDVKNQSTKSDKIEPHVLSIKNLSIFSEYPKDIIIRNLKSVVFAYEKWINEQLADSGSNKIRLENLEKCKAIKQRILEGINLLAEDELAFKAFKLANSAIYIQMFQNELYFRGRREGFEVYGKTNEKQLSFQDYYSATYPDKGEIPKWRPFQLAFILQSLKSFIHPNCDERKLIDLLYFPTGGGKTEAYLAVSAFLIFLRRLKHPDKYGGVNVIIRYTLRLLSAQQFERATKLILACEFIRRNNEQELGDKKISIGFWIGGKTIPNRHQDTEYTKGAKSKYDRTIERLQKGENVINPFQITNCQWCNTKTISKEKPDDKHFVYGHRHTGRKLLSFCTNPTCHFSENNGGYPIVMIDEDIYKEPPTVLFATVDKFARLAWEESATSLFNTVEGNLPPELIIQDELHLLNGPLGSLVGLFENVMLDLCSGDGRIPKVIASTATVKNVGQQVRGLYGREVSIFPQYATNADDTFFSKRLSDSKRKYVGILPTGKTTVMTKLQLLAALLFARLEILESNEHREFADQYWTILSYYKSLKELGRFSNKVTSELKPVIKQLQQRLLKNDDVKAHNYHKLSWRTLELTSRIPNERIKRNLDNLTIEFNGDIKNHRAYELVLATNMISVGLDIGRLGIMLINGMPPNTAEYIQASSRVARVNEGMVVTLFDPNNTRDLSFFEDFVQFHKTFYKQVAPLSVTPFAESGLDKMLFTSLIVFFRHKLGYTANNTAAALADNETRARLKESFKQLFEQHPFLSEEDKDRLIAKTNNYIENWKAFIDRKPDLKYYWYGHPEVSLLKPMEEKQNDSDILIAMQSMRNVEPNTDIQIKPY